MTINQRSRIRFFLQRTTSGRRIQERDARIFNLQFSIFNLLKCLPPFVPMPPLLRSNAYSYIVQGISTPRSRHQHASFKASARLVPGIPTNGSRHSRHPSPTQAGRHVARCSVAVHNEALFFLYLYLYLYIYKYIYKYKISFRHLALLDKQLQHCNAARNCAESHNCTNKL